MKNPNAQQPAAREAPPDNAWLVSPAADLLKDGRWKVRWTVLDPPKNARWAAVLVDYSDPGPAPSCPADPCGTPSPAWGSLNEYGIDYARVIDATVASNSHKRTADH
ncbi:hypothetical protein GCM10009612_50680 [Streptomyces beijiangensis]